MKLVVTQPEGLRELRQLAMQSLDESGLENVSDSAYLLKPGFTPNYMAMAVELPHLAGHQLRVVGTMTSIAEVPYDATDERVHAATRGALRALMIGMRDQAQKWLDENPEEQP